MQRKSTTMMKTVGIGMIAGGATAAIGSMMKNTNSSKKYRKMANKAVKTAGSVVDAINSLHM